MSMVALRNSVGRFDLNIFAEGFLKGLLNILYGYNLENLNVEKKNVPSIDLADKTKRVAFQITSSDSAKKIHSTIQTFISERLYEQYDRLRFLIIKGRRKQFRADFQTQGQLHFNKEEDILTFYDLFDYINGLETEKVIQIAKYLDSELPELLEHIAKLIREDARLINSPAPEQAANNLKLYLFNVGLGHTVLLHLPNGEYGLINFCYQAGLNQTEPPSLTYLNELIRKGLPVTIAFVLVTDINLDAIKGASRFFEWAIANNINVREVWLGPSFLMSIFDIAGLQKHERHRFYRSTFGNELLKQTLAFKDKYKRLEQFKEISEIIGFTKARDKTPKFLINIGQILLQHNTHRLLCLSSPFHVPYAPVLLIEAGSYRLIFGGEASQQAWARIHKELQEENIEHEADLIIASHSGSKHSSDKKVWKSLMGENKTVHVMFSASERPYGHPHRETLQDISNAASEKNVDLHVHSTNAATNDIVKNYPVILKKSQKRPSRPLEVEVTLKPMRPARAPSRKSSLIAFEAEFLNDGLKNIIVRSIISEPSDEF